MISKKKFYLREGDELTGPFCSRADAERFLTLLDLFGEGHQGIDIVERCISISPTPPSEPQSDKS